MLAEQLTRGLLCNLQVGDEVPDVTPSALKGAWEATQQLLRQRKISAGHDISDGGIATTLLEMSFSGNTGISVSCCIEHSPFMHCAGNQNISL